MSKPFEILHRSIAHDGFLKVVRYQLRHASFHGGWCEPVFRERLEKLSAVSVLPYDPLTDQVVLVEQFRVGTMDSPAGPWVLETIGGYRAPDESAEQVARRELLEEAGLACGELAAVGGFYVSPGISSERIELYCARVDASAAGGIHGIAEEGEETRVIVLPVAEALGELFGRINSTSTLILLQWLAANRERLRAAWSAPASVEP
jgi:ADP-ribose pyrophosphatase